ncbi:MAG: 3-hydroxyacyl-CoA dehydrogenase family protein, partial [Leadbetterella sp.]
MNRPLEIKKVGVVGLGLMGCSIVADLLIHDREVVGIAPIEDDFKRAIPKISHYLKIAFENGFSQYPVETALTRFSLSRDYSDLKDRQLVMECVIENVEIKKSVYQQVEKYVDTEAIITSNTSAIPITVLKDFLQYPARFMGMHYAEPSFASRFLEIVCSPDTDIQKAEFLYETSKMLGKEPTLVRKDIRGFITNRIMYAMYREA